MNNVSFGNLTNTKTLSPDIQKRMQSEENFGAIDKNKIKQDTVEIAKKTVKENFIFRTLRNVFGVQEPKKFLTSLGLTVATIASFTLLGRKTGKQAIQLGQKVDDLVQKSATLQKVGEFASGFKKKVGGFFDKFDFTQDIKDVFKNKRLSCIQPMAKTQLAGPKGQFSYNVVDTIQAIHTKILGKDFVELKKAFGHGFAHAPKARVNALEFIRVFKKSDAIKNEILNLRSGSASLSESKMQEFISRLTDIDGIKKIFGGKKSRAIKTQEVFEDLKKLGFGDDDAKTLLSKLTSLVPLEKGSRTIKANMGEAEAVKLLQKLKGGNEKLEASVRKLVGSDCDNLKYFYENFMDINTDPDRAGFAQKLTLAIAKNKGLNPSDKNYSKELAQILLDLSDGKYGDEFTQITMNREGILQGWSIWNAIDSLGSKIFKSKWKPFAKSNLGNALANFNMADGKLASTAAGKLTQKIPLYLGESVSNNVADLATINMLVSVPLFMDLFNNTQDAPKEQKVATLADGFVGGLGQFAFTMPIASGLVYGAASLKNLKGNNPLKWIGSIIGMGLPKIKDGIRMPETNILKRFGGGALRFWAIMLFMSPKITNAINKCVHKVFGKPYDSEEAKKAKEFEEQSKVIIPELGISQGEFLQKLQNNPEVITKMQNDPALLQAAQANPKIILDLLDGKEVNVNNPKPKFDGTKIISPANSNLIKNRPQMLQNSATTIQNNVVNNVQASNPPETTISNSVDTATYIPSSTFTAKSSISPEQQSKFDAAMAKADKLMTQAQKYI